MKENNFNVNDENECKLYECIKDMFVQDSSVYLFKKGHIYREYDNDYILCEEGRPIFISELRNRYFRPFNVKDEVSRMLTPSEGIDYSRFILDRKTAEEYSIIPTEKEEVRKPCVVERNYMKGKITLEGLNCLQYNLIHALVKSWS